MIYVSETAMVRYGVMPPDGLGVGAACLSMPRKEPPVIDTDFPPASREATAARLSVLREALGFPRQDQWCEKTGIKQSAWSQYERDIHKISSDAAIAICDRFPGLTTDWIYRGLDKTILPYHLSKIEEVREARRRLREEMSGRAKRSKKTANQNNAN